ncbi:MAG: cytochrome c biogenesis protein CcdA [Nitrospinota bacterium]
MNLFDFVIFPLLIGLLGFITPCSLGVNLIILNYGAGLQTSPRFLLIATFTLVRALFLALMGLGVAFMSQSFMGFMMGYNRVLGLGFVALGVFVAFGHLRGFSMPGLSLMRGRRGGGRVLGGAALGATFGLTIPACDTPLLLALLAKVALTGNLFLGFGSLLIFGLATSLPLLFLSLHERANELFRRLQRGGAGVSYAAGGTLVLVGLLLYSPRFMWFLFSLPASLFS